MASRVVIFGPGGFGREIHKPLLRRLELAKDHRVVVFAADHPEMGSIHADEIGDDDEVLIALGSSQSRREVAQRIKGRPGRLIASTALIGPNVEIGTGTVICDFAMVTCDAQIGQFFQCNIYSYVAHDCVIGDFVTFAPRVCCNGNVTIGSGSYIGTGACIRPGVNIGNDVTVGMGAIVTKDVADGLTVVGNPARPM